MSGKLQFTEFAPTFGVDDPRHAQNMRLLIPAFEKLRTRVAEIEGKTTEEVESVAGSATAPLRIERDGSHGLKIGNYSAQTGTPLVVDPDAKALNFKPAAAVADAAVTLASALAQLNALMAALRAANIMVT